MTQHTIDILGMYPRFYMPWIGSAWVMGIIGVIHIVASHTSVGASFLFALLETKAYRENKPQLMDFIKRAHIAQGSDKLYEHAIKGFNAMPARGSCTDCSDADIRKVVDYMVSKSK